MANQQQIATEEQRDIGITITKDLKWQKQTEKNCKTARIHCLQLQQQKHRTDAPTLQVAFPTSTGICSPVLVTTFMKRHR